MAWSVFLDAADVTPYVQTSARTRTLNKSWSATCKLPSQFASITEGETELILVEGGTVHAGRAYYGEDDGDADNQMTTINSYDDTIFFDRRQVMDPDGDYSDPTIIEDNGTAVAIFEAAIDNSITNDGSFGVAVGSAAGGGVPLIGFRPVDWPMTIEDLRVLLVDTGELDFIQSPASGGAMTLALFNGDAGSDLSGSVTLDYNTGTRNCVAAKYTFDMAELITRIRYLLGPKRPQYPEDIQHWAGDVQKDDPDLPDPPQSDIDALIAAGEAAWPLLRRINIYDSNGDENALRDLYFRIWQSDMIAHLRPRRLLQMTPQPGMAVSFNVGDIITANAVLRGATGGAQRVYSYTVEQDDLGNQQLTSVVTSADQEV